MTDDIVEETSQVEYNYKFLYKPELLEVIKDMLSENLLAMKCAGVNSDYISGAVVGLRELATKLELCEYEDLIELKD